MISKKDVKEVINKSEDNYLGCWETISDIKGGRIDSDHGGNLVSYQTTLARTLFDLDSMYRRLHQEKKSLIKKKSSVSPKWFKSRIKLIREYQEIIKTAIGVGKCLGDFYAWIFYHDQREYIIEHYERPKQFHSPPGIGGKGELEFIDKFKIIEGHLVLYHGITTFLRIGDVSFYDLKNKDISAIGELKTRRINSEEIDIKLVAIGQVEKRNFFEDINNIVEEERVLDSRFSQQQEGRLKKQVNLMAASLAPKEVEKKMNVRMSSGLDLLDDLNRDIKRSQVNYQKVGDGQMIMAYRNTGKTLYSRIAGESKIDWNKKLSGATEKVLDILDEGSSEIRLYIFTLLNPTENYELQIGAIPIIWWPLDLNLLKKIVFHKVQFASAYNPLHLVRKLEDIGLKVEFGIDRNDIKVSKRVGEEVITIERFPFFINLIIKQFFSEDIVVEMVERIVSEIEEGKLPRNTRIDLNIYQHM